MTGLDEDTREYLTGQEVAALLRVSLKSVCRWALADPSMPVLKIGRTVRFPRERLFRWLKTREQGMGRSKQPRELLPSHKEPPESKEQSVTECAPCARV